MINRKNTDNMMHQSAECSDTITLTDYCDAVAKSYHQQLLELADTLIKEEQRHRYSLAIIVAHMACEMVVEQAVAKFPRKLKMNRYNLGNKDCRKRYTKLTGDDIQNQTSFWGKFEESAERRNDIVHNRLIPSPEEAAESLVATTALIRYLEHRYDIA